MKKTEVDIEKIHDLIFKLSTGDFTSKVKVSKKADYTDTIISGINMLGEELESITVSRDYFSSIYNAISDLLVVVNKEGNILKVNKAVLDKLKSQEDSIISKNVLLFFPEEGKRTVNKVISSFKNGKSNQSFEAAFSFNDIRFPVRCSVSKIIDHKANHEGFLIIASDITFEKKMEQEIINAIIFTEEKEKTRIAYDLHDSLGQELNAIKMYFDVALRSQADRDKFGSIITDCKKLIDNSIDSVRAIAKDLMPKALEDGELFYALNELSSSYSHIIDIDKNFPEVEYRLSLIKKVKIYRIIQEFISNTIKHAQASKIELVSNSKKDKYYFILKDNGVGFDKSKVKLGNGIKNIETRLKALNALYSFASTTNKGTTLKFEICR